jgi:hypothetical protein
MKWSGNSRGLLPEEGECRWWQPRFIEVDDNNGGGTTSNGSFHRIQLGDGTLLVIFVILSTILLLSSS